MIFLKVLILKNVKKHLENVIYVNSIILYGPYLCDGCYDISLKAINMKNLAITYRGEQDYRINFAFMSKNDAFNLIKNSVIIDKKGTL